VAAKCGLNPRYAPGNSPKFSRDVAESKQHPEMPAKRQRDTRDAPPLVSPIHSRHESQGAGVSSKTHAHTTNEPTAPRTSSYEVQRADNRPLSAFPSSTRQGGRDVGQNAKVRPPPVSYVTPGRFPGKTRPANIDTMCTRHAQCLASLPHLCEALGHLPLQCTRGMSLKWLTF
jgi:hypothetical protein